MKVHSAGVALLLALCPGTAAAARPHGTEPPAPRAAVAAAPVQKCRQFTMVRVRNGHNVRVRVAKCVHVPSKSCRVSWAKQHRHGRVVVVHGNPVWIPTVTCPVVQQSTGSSSTGSGPAAPAPTPIPTGVATYSITVTGTVFSGSTNFLEPDTVFTPIGQSTLTGGLLVEPPVGVDFTPQGQTTNGVNARDVGFFVGSPLLAEPGIYLVTDSYLFSQVRLDLPTLAPFDDAFVTANEQAGQLDIRLDGDLNGLPYARQVLQNAYGVPFGIVGDLAQILTGNAHIQFSTDGQTVSGTINVGGGGVIEPGSSAYQATFTGTRTS
jgi:hypothetical protein